MVLERAKNLVRMGVDSARELLPLVARDGRYPDSQLWILSHGFFNGFQSVIDTLRNVEMQSADALLHQAISEWLEVSKESRERRLGNWRNLMTHQGKALTTKQTMKWETDDWNDTVRPVPGPAGTANSTMHRT